MELLQEIAVDIALAESVADSTATGIPPLGPSRVFRFNRPRVVVCAPSELRFDYQPLFSTF